MHGLVRVHAHHRLSRAIRVDHGCAHRVGDPLGHRALSRRDDAADGDHGRKEERAAARRESEQEVAACVLCRPPPCHVVDFRVRGQHRGDFRPHERAIALVEVDQGVQVEVIRLARITGQEALGEVHAPVNLEVHGEERDVRADVGEAETIVELDAVDDGRVARALEVHVLQTQVPVTVSNAASERASLERGRMTAQERRLPADDLGPLGGRIHLDEAESSRAKFSSTLRAIASGPPKEAIAWLVAAPA